MAVDASNIAFPDLLEDPRPTSGHGEDSDRLPLQLRITMIELEHQDVPLPAVDTGVREQVRVDLSTILRSSTVHLCDGAAHVVGPICKIVGAPVCGVATAA